MNTFKKFIIAYFIYLIALFTFIGIMTAIDYNFGTSILSVCDKQHNKTDN